MESATSCKLREAHSGTGWGVSEILTAVLIDSVRENTYANMQVRTKKKLTPPESVPIPGVGDKKKPKTANRFVQMAQQQFAKSRR